MACGAVEALVDACARAAEIDPAEFRRRNFRREGTTPSGVQAGGLSHEACLDRLLALMDYEGSQKNRKSRNALRGRHLGIGLAAFVEQNSPGAGFYGAAGVKISPQEGCTLRLEPSGSGHVHHIQCRPGAGSRDRARAAGRARSSACRWKRCASRAATR